MGTVAERRRGGRRLTAAHNTLGQRTAAPVAPPRSPAPVRSILSSPSAQLAAAGLCCWPLCCCPFSRLGKAEPRPTQSESAAAAGGQSPAVAGWPGEECDAVQRHLPLLLLPDSRRMTTAVRHMQRRPTQAQRGQSAVLPLCSTAAPGATVHSHNQPHALFTPTTTALSPPSAPDLHCCPLPHPLSPLEPSSSTHLIYVR